jgi:dihydroxy-acid dehydratase
MIEVDVPNRILNVDISDADMAARREKWVAPPPRYERGWGQMYTQHIEQADKGCDFDFLRTDFGSPVPEPEIN